jgi:hypothetical protein
MKLILGGLSPICYKIVLTEGAAICYLGYLGNRMYIKLFLLYSHRLFEKEAAVTMLIPIASGRTRYHLTGISTAPLYYLSFAACLCS